MKVWIFVEGPSEVKALSALLNDWKRTWVLNDGIFQ